MTRVVRILSRIESAEDWIGKAVSMLLMPMVGLLVYEVVSRYAFNAPTIWAHETSKFMYGTTGILLGAYTLRHRGHVTLDIVYRRLSPRKQAIMDSITAVIFFILLGVLLWKSWGIAYNSLMIGEHTDSPWGPPIFPVKLMIPLGATLMIVQGIVKFTRDIFFAISGRKLQ